MHYSFQHQKEEKRKRSMTIGKRLQGMFCDMMMSICDDEHKNKKIYN